MESVCSSVVFVVGAVGVVDTTFVPEALVKPETVWKRPIAARPELNPVTTVDTVSTFPPVPMIYANDNAIPNRTDIRRIITSCNGALTGNMVCSNIGFMNNEISTATAP